MTRDDTKVLLATISSIYPNFNVPDKTATLTVWAAILEPYDRKLIMDALKNFSRTNTSGFAPTTGQLIEEAYKCSDSGIIPESQAWDMLMKALRNGQDGYKEEYEKLPLPIQKYLGSPWQLHMWANDSDFKESVERALFAKSYSGICESLKRSFVANGMKQSIALTATENLALETSAGDDIMKGELL